ncbi:MAG: hypothetical protein M3418_11195 [Gemmatimonadota bacterium]|nr:hypothetical protein [Gemmatimonadota bacterium]
MADLQEAVRKRDYPAAANFALQSLPQLEAWQKEESAVNADWFVPPSIPALEVGGTMLALAGDEEGLAEMRRVVERVHSLHPRLADMDAHAEDLGLIREILRVVAENPACLQTSLKGHIGTNDGRAIGRLVGWLEKAGRAVEAVSGVHTPSRWATG